MPRRHVPLSLAFAAISGSAVLAAAPPRPAAPAAEAPAPLAALTTAQVRARLGEPAVASEEGKGALWTYRREGCALMVFFRDAGRGLRVSAVTASGRKRGDAPPPVDRCIEAAAEG